MTPVDYRFKIVIIGEWGVGKTSLARNFVHQKFEMDYLPTIGANVLVQNVTITRDGKDFHISLAIWDIAGQREFEMMRPAYYAGAKAAILVGDLTRVRSFEDLELWDQEFKKLVEEDHPPSILLANKMDLEHYLDFSYVEEIGEKMGVMKVFKTSAVTGDNVNTAFQLIAEKLFDRYVPISERVEVSPGKN